MKTTKIFKSLAFFLCLALIAAMALTAIGCNGSENESGAASESQRGDAKDVGSGEKSFYLSVSDAEKNETRFIVHTDKEIVGDALLELSLIAGDESAFGLYVKTVNGITADYDVDGTYWAFYVEDALSMVGVDAVKIEDGAHYSFKVEK